MLITNSILKLFYSSMLFGMPPIMNNPINKNTLYSPFVVQPFSTYINFKLDKEQIDYIKLYLKKYSNNLKLVSSKINKNDTKDYYLSINIYNCTSPLFYMVSNEPITRCEINTYISNTNNITGTLIMDYVSNKLSIDPDNIFKNPETLKFYNKVDDISNNVMHGFANSKNIFLSMKYNITPKNNIIKENNIDQQLISLSDHIFYNNGIYDKLFYDSSLINNKIVFPNYFDIYFKFFDLEFTKPHSVFYFTDTINFIGGMWDNINDNNNNFFKQN